MKTVKSILRSEAIFSVDDMHRLSHMKTWNTKQSVGYGGVYLMNLFTNVKINDAYDEIEVLTHESANDYLGQAIENSDDVILAWGASSSKITSGRIHEVNQLLKAYRDKVKMLMNPSTKSISHPLNPMCRRLWMVENLDDTKEEK